jgi:hypothetical protein
MRAPVHLVREARAELVVGFEQGFRIAQVRQAASGSRSLALSAW